MNLKNKKILITAGPTWVPIDNVRVISNIATGQTGILLAKAARAQGAKVSLVLGPIEKDFSCNSIKIFRFRYFEELRDTLKYLLKNNKYDIIIHSAAVSDFRPAKPIKGKLASDKVYNLRLLPLPKIIRDIRCLASGAKLVMFKLESGVSDATLIRRAKLAQNKAGADIVVANRINPYRAFIIDKKGNIISAGTKNILVNKLLKIVDLTPNT